jgi:hypothetical protein
MSIQPDHYKREDLMKFRTNIIHDMMHLPGILCVSVGLKEKKGEYTGQLCFKIYVKEKLNTTQLLPQNLIPKYYKGFLTDVVVMKTMQKVA